MFEQGKSDKEMALALGAEFPELGRISRSSVIGKRHRLDLLMDPVATKHKQRMAAREYNRSAPARRTQPIKKSEPRLPRTLPAVVHNITMKAQEGKPVRDFSLDIDFKDGLVCEPVSLMDLEPHMCRWPLDRGGFCGRPKREGEWFPYCSHHVALGRRTVRAA